MAWFHDFVLRRYPSVRHQPARRRRTTTLGQFESLERRCMLAAQPIATALIGGDASDNAWATTANDEGYYVAGAFRNTVDFAPQEDLSAVGNPDIRTAAAGERNLYVAHYAHDGTFLWVRDFSAGADEVGENLTFFESVTHDRDGNLYLAGRMFNPVQFDSYALTPRTNRDAEGNPLPSVYDSFLVKLDSSGDVLWAEPLLGELVGEVIVDDHDASSANWRVYTSSADTLQPEIVSNLRAYDGVVRARQATDAQVLWTTQINNGAIWSVRDSFGNDRMMSPEIALGGLAHDQLYVSGAFVGSIVLGGTSLSSKHQGLYRTDIFLARLNTSGSVVWARAFGGVNNEEGIGAVAADDAGNVYIAGRGSGPFSLAGTTFDPVWSGVFVARFDGNGNATWLTPLHDDVHVSPTDLIIGQNSIFGATTINFFNAHYWELNLANGAQQGAWSLSGASTTVRGLAGAPDGEVYAVGNFQDTATGPDGSTWTSNGAMDVYVLKFGPPPPAPPQVASLSDSPDPVVLGQALTLAASGVTDPDGQVVSVGFYHDTNGNGQYEEAVDELLAVDNSATGGWSASISTTNLGLGSHTYFAIATDNSGLTSAAVSSTGDVVDAPPGSANDMYVWNINVEQRTKGKKKEARFQVTIRRDSDANASASGTDATVSGAAVTLVVRNRVTNAVITTITGTTNSSGVLTTGWTSSLAAGEYYVEVTALTHPVYVWNGMLDPTSNDDDVDNDGLPDELFTVT